MKELFTPVAVLCLCAGLLSAGCRTPENYAYTTASGVKAIVIELRKQFGINAGYSSIHMRYSDTGLVLTASAVAERLQDSLVVRQFLKGKWKELAVSALSNDGDSVLLFSLQDINDLKILPELVKSSIHRMATEYNKPGLDVKEVLVNAPGYDVGRDPVRINVYVKPKYGDSKYEFAYNSAGELKSAFAY